MKELEFVDKNAMDTTIRPQDDLFRYINGIWLAEYELPADRASDGSFRRLLEESLADCRELCENANSAEIAFPTEIDTKLAAKYSAWIAALYRSYMDTESLDRAGVEPIRALWDKVDAAKNHRDLARVAGELEHYGVNSGLGFYISPDVNNPERYLPHFSQGGIGLPDESYYREEKHAEVCQQYRQFIAKFIEAGGLATSEAAADWARTIWEYEKALAKYHWDTVKCRDSQATNNPTTWDKVCQIKGFDFTAWAQGMGLTGAIKNNRGESITLKDLSLNIPDFIENGARVWAETPLDTLKRVFKYRVLRSFASYLSDNLQQIRFDFYSTVLNGVPQRSEKWKRAVSIVEDNLGEVLGQAYVTKYFPPEYKKKMEELTQRLIDAYESSIKSLDWMGEETKTKALDKLHKFVSKIGYPAQWKDYSPLPECPKAAGLAELIGIINAFETDYQLARIYGPIDKHEWLMTPQTVNAYYHPVVNEIVFPAGILRPPFFFAEAPEAVNFGAIGAVIGHEIGHGFDDQGSQYDGNGKLHNWWTDTDRAEFEKRTKALIGQYDAYVPADLAGEDVHVNGALTIGENIGDLGGLSIAFKALSAGGEPTEEEKRQFFFAWAYAWQSKCRKETARQYLIIDPHSPAEFRCNGVVRNMDVFHETFQTKPGDTLWLEKDQRVRIWE